MHRRESLTYIVKIHHKPPSSRKEYNGFETTVRRCKRSADSLQFGDFEGILPVGRLRDLLAGHLQESFSLKSLENSTTRLQVGLPFFQAEIKVICIYLYLQIHIRLKLLRSYRKSAKKKINK